MKVDLLPHRHEWVHCWDCPGDEHDYCADLDCDDLHFHEPDWVGCKEQR